MSLLKPRLMTPAALAARRRNGLKSTGPRTARGKAQSRLNLPRQGWSLPAHHRLLRALMAAAPGTIEETARAVLTPQQAAHPKFAELVTIFRQVEIAVCARSGQLDGTPGAIAGEASATPNEA